MAHTSRYWRSFLRRHRQRLTIIMILAVINILTSLDGEFRPWFLFPAFFIALPLIQDLFGTLLGEEDAEAEKKQRKKKQKETLQEQDTDNKASQQSQAQSVAPPPDYRPDDLTSPTIQAHLDRARTYQEQIEALIQATVDPYSRDRLQDLSRQISEWTEAIEGMGRRIDRFQQNTVIHHDLEIVPRSIEKLESQLAQETDETIRTELQRTLASRQHQLATLQQLQNTMKQAEIKIESTLASLGTIYSQLLTSQSTDHVADYSRLSTEVNEEVRTLQDHLEALEEVKLGRSA